MKIRLLFALTATVLAIACGTGDESNDVGSGLSALLPSESDMQGWRIADGPITYDSVSLYEYLNGGAPLYLDFGFNELVHTRYQLGEDSLSSVTLDVFDMGSEIGSFGLFRSGRPADAEVLRWGAEGYRSGVVAAAWKGNIAIHAEADDDRPELTDAMEHLVESVANAVVGGTSPPSIINLLPPDGMVPWSERIVANNLMSHEFLPGGVVAIYQVADEEGTLFFSQLSDEPAATEAMAKLRAHHEQWGEILGDIESIADGGFRFSDMGLGPGTVVASGPFIVGVHGELPDDVKTDLLTQLVENLGPQ
jgi:hypothetical protein